MGDAYLLPILMLIGLMAGIFSGYPVAFVLAGVGLLFAFASGVPMLFLRADICRRELLIEIEGMAVGTAR